jgi:mono/diheme cytochrome c family protein
MNKGLFKRIFITLSIPAALLLVGLLFTYQVIPIHWVSTMEIQNSFRPMEDPLPVPERSVPVQGAAFLPGAGNPANPTPADAASVERGKQFFITSCYVCHGAGAGDGPVADKLTRKPADLTGANVQELSDGEIFIVITNGVRFSDNQISMPDLRENLAVNDRWDVVNYVRSLQQP